MFRIIAVVQLVLLALFIYNQGKKYGLSFLADGGKMMMMLWLTTISLYNLQLSTLYAPTLTINIVVMIIVIIFYILTRFVSLEKRDIFKVLENIKEEETYKKYFWISNIIIIVGTLVFAFNVYKHGLAILDENRINKQKIDHYAVYIVHMLALAAQIKYILFRSGNRIKGKIIDGFGFLVAVGVLFLTLNRGPIAFIIIAIYVYEIFNIVKVKERLSKKQTYIAFGAMILAAVGFIQFFGYIGNARMEFVLKHILHKPLYEHYGVSEYMPSGLIWVYIYMTSNLDNAAFALANGAVQHTYFNNLFYPFIKFFANLVGKGGEYKAWIDGRMEYTPYLDKRVGLNVMSFIPESIQDGSYFGIVFYVAIYVALAILAVYLIKRSKKFSSLGALIVYANVLNILMWSVFDNSLKIPILILNIFAIIFIEKLILQKTWWKLWKRR